MEVWKTDCVMGLLERLRQELLELLDLSRSTELQSLHSSITLLKSVVDSFRNSLTPILAT